MNKIKNVEILQEIRKAMEMNEVAVDYMQECIMVHRNHLGFDPDDEWEKEELKIAEYIQCLLYFADECFMKTYKAEGGKL